MKEGVEQSTPATDSVCCKICPDSNHSGYKTKCFDEAPGRVFEYVAGAPEPTIRDGYIRIEGGSCKAANQLADSQTPSGCDGVDADDCFTKGKKMCDDWDTCVSFEMYYGYPQTVKPLFFGMSSSCNLNGYPAQRRKNGKSDLGAGIDFYIKLKFPDPTGFFESSSDGKFKLGTRGANDCPQDYQAIANGGTCKTAAKALNFKHYDKNWRQITTETDASYPKGCYWLEAAGEWIVLNNHVDGAPNYDARPICIAS
jgi:hypothetical protein